MRFARFRFISNNFDIIRHFDRKQIRKFQFISTDSVAKCRMQITDRQNNVYSFFIVGFFFSPYTKEEQGNKNNSTEDRGSRGAGKGTDKVHDVTAVVQFARKCEKEMLQDREKLRCKIRRHSLSLYFVRSPPHKTSNDCITDLHRSQG